MRITILTAVALLLGACASQDHAPLFFGQAQTLGISVGASPASQTPEMTLGFKDVNVAVVPTLDPARGTLIHRMVLTTPTRRLASSMPKEALPASALASSLRQALLRGGWPTASPARFRMPQKKVVRTRLLRLFGERPASSTS